jgi:hypothetical protein
MISVLIFRVGIKQGNCPNLIKIKKNSYASVLDLRKFIKVHTQLKHCLKILSIQYTRLTQDYLLKTISAQNLGK